MTGYRCINDQSYDAAALNKTKVILENRQGSRVVDVVAFYNGRLDFNADSINLTPVAIDSPMMQPCTVYL